MLIHVLSVLPDGSVHWTGTPLPAKLDVRTSILNNEGLHTRIPNSIPIPPRVRRNRQRLPSSLLIENASVKQRQAISETPAKGGGAGFS